MFKYIMPLFRPFSKTIMSAKKSGQILADLVTSNRYEGLSSKYFNKGNEERSSDKSFNKKIVKELWKTSERINKDPNP